MCSPALRRCWQTGQRSDKRRPIDPGLPAGREGAEIKFDLADGVQADGSATLAVYTTRADTLMGVTYMAVAATHPIALQVSEGNAEIAAFIDENPPYAQDAQYLLLNREKL